MTDHTQRFQIVKAVVLRVPVPVMDVEQIPFQFQTHPAVLTRPAIHLLVGPGNGRPVLRVLRGPRSRPWGYHWGAWDPAVFFRLRIRFRTGNHPEDFQDDSARESKEVDENQHPHDCKEEVEHFIQRLTSPSLYRSGTSVTTGAGRGLGSPLERAAVIADSESAHFPLTATS